MYNISPLFYKKLQKDRFIDNISISIAQTQMLLEARRSVRRAIRTAFHKPDQYLGGLTEDKSSLISNITPKFMTQGSFAYKTLNSPCHQSQEIDLDDGVYLPVSLLNKEPGVASELFFALVDSALNDLVIGKPGWRVDRSKDTCARLVLPNQAHIDVPLYAISDERFAQMGTFLSLLSQQQRSLSDVIFSDDSAISRDYLLDESQVYLATRRSGWKLSDPLQIANWFKLELSVKGQRLRRVCRFLKAWRDFVWTKDGPSSLALMVAAADSYPIDDQDRDDIALLAIVKELPNKLRGEIVAPWSSAQAEEVIYPRESDNDEEAGLAADRLLESLESSMSGSHGIEHIPQTLRRNFGDRMPANIDYIEIIDAAAIVRSIPARKVRAERIPNTRSA